MAPCGIVPSYFLFGVELRKLLPGAEYFGSGRSFAPENCVNRNINTLKIQDLLKWSLSCNDWKQSQVTGRIQLSKNSALSDSLRSNRPFKKSKTKGT